MDAILPQTSPTTNNVPATRKAPQAPPPSKIRVAALSIWDIHGKWLLFESCEDSRHLFGGTVVADVATNERHKSLEWGADNNLCLRLGDDSGVFMLDIDHGELGAREFAKLEANLGSLDTLKIITPNGFRLVFNIPVDKRVRSRGIGETFEHIEVLSDGQFCLMPPSTDEGAKYGWANGIDYPVRDLPERWVKHLSSGESPVISSRIEVDYEDHLRFRYMYHEGELLQTDEQGGWWVNSGYNDDVELFFSRTLNQTLPKKKGGRHAALTGLARELARHRHPGTADPIDLKSTVNLWHKRVEETVGCEASAYQTWQEFLAIWKNTKWRRDHVEAAMAKAKLTPTPTWIVSQYPHDFTKQTVVKLAMAMGPGEWPLAGNLLGSILGIRQQPASLILRELREDRIIRLVEEFEFRTIRSQSKANVYTLGDNALLHTPLSPLVLPAGQLLTPSSLLVTDYAPEHVGDIDLSNEKTSRNVDWKPVAKPVAKRGPKSSLAPELEAFTMTLKVGAEMKIGWIQSQLGDPNRETLRRCLKSPSSRWKPGAKQGDWKVVKPKSVKKPKPKSSKPKQLKKKPRPQVMDYSAVVETDVDAEHRKCLDLLGIDDWYVPSLRDFDDKALSGALSKVDYIRGKKKHFYSADEKGHRRHTVFSQLDKNLYWYSSLDGERNLSIADLGASQPYALGILAAVNFQPESRFDSINPIAIDELSDQQRHWLFGGLYAGCRVEVASKSFTYWDKKKKGEVEVRYDDLDYKGFKAAALRPFFDKKSKAKENPAYQYFMEVCPEVTNYVDWLKSLGAGHKIVAHLATRFESYLMQGALAEVYARQIIALLIHDGIYCKTADVDVVVATMRQHIAGVTGIPPKISNDSVRKTVLSCYRDRDGVLTHITAI